MSFIPVNVPVRKKTQNWKLSTVLFLFVASVPSTFYHPSNDQRVLFGIQFPTTPFGTPPESELCCAPEMRKKVGRAFFSSLVKS